MFDAVEPEELEPATAPVPGPQPWRGLTPGPAALQVLSGVSFAGRPAAELAELLGAWEAQAAWVAAQSARLTAALAGRIERDCLAEGEDNGTAIESLVTAEVTAALHMGPNAAARRIHVAEALCDRLTDTLAALTEGRLSYWHAAAVAEETQGLNGDQARLVERKVLPRAGAETVGGLRARLRKAVALIDPRDSTERAREAAERRHVSQHPAEDGMAELRAFGPAPAVQALYEALDVTAGRAPSTDPRPIGARRFDALVDLAVHTLDTGSCPPTPRIPATVHVVMDVPTLLGLQDHPAELLGYGPLPAPLARALALDNGWRRLVVDPVTGAPQDLGRTRAAPSAELARWIRLRDLSCCFPGCHRTAERCHLDHREQRAHGGGTDTDNLTPLCPRHHRVRHRGWSYVRHPDRVVWTSRYGETYTRYLPNLLEDLELAGYAGLTCPAESEEFDDPGACIPGMTRPDPDPVLRPPRYRTTEFDPPEPDPPEPEESEPAEVRNVLQIEEWLDPDSEPWPVDDRAHREEHAGHEGRPVQRVVPQREGLPRAAEEHFLVRDQAG